MSRDTSDQSIQSLGKPIYSHGPSPANIVAGILLGFACLGGGTALAVYHISEFGDGEWTLQALLLDWLGVVLFFVGGVGLLVWMYRLIGFRLFVCPEGFYYVRRGKTHVFPWSEIVEIHETVAHESVLPGRGVAQAMSPTRVRRSYQIQRRDGLCFKVGVNTLPQISLLVGPLKAAADRLGIPWHVQELGTSKAKRHS